ncbi:MAG: lysostaphin resistance A-like protein [Hyphomonadaceae bacterium]
MPQTIFLNSANRLRNGWWIAIFLAMLTALLLPLIVLADRGDGRVPLYQQLGIILVASLLCQAMRRASVAELLGALDFRWLRELSFGLVLGALLMIVPAAFLLLIGAVSWQVNPDAWAVLPATLALLLTAAAAEELLFRGFMFQRLVAGLGAWPAQLAMAALFTLTHADALGTLGDHGFLAGANIFFASLLFGLAFLRTGSLALPIGIHFAANAVQGPLLGFGVSGGDAPGLLVATTQHASSWLTGGEFGLEASAPGFVSVVALIAIVWRLPRPGRKTA